MLFHLGIAWVAMVRVRLSLEAWEGNWIGWVLIKCFKIPRVLLSIREPAGEDRPSLGPSAIFRFEDDQCPDLNNASTFEKYIWLAQTKLTVPA